jgi:hypothetical protein
MTAPGSLLNGSTVYLSGPMDFVVSRDEEATVGWRSRITDVLEAWGVRVFDPWFKPAVRNLGRYGLEDETSTDARKDWVFDDDPDGARTRSRLSGDFWPVMHIDLRMVDLSDFLVACCPTNLYSVGTPHEIVVARQQRKPVLLVSPPVRYPRWRELEQKLADLQDLRSLLAAAGREVVVRENPTGVPSQWYMTLVGSESFFDGFGWAGYRERFGWPENYLDERERGEHAPRRPLLPYLEALGEGRLPQRWDRAGDRYRDNDDWLLLEKQAEEREDGAEGNSG